MVRTTGHRRVPGRPSGTDGTDYPYRMTTDNRYKKVVEKKLQLQKLLMAQTIFQLIKAVQVVLMAMNGDVVARAACVFGGVAIASGTLGLRQTSTRLLQFFILATGATLVLSFIELVAGYNKVCRLFSAGAAYKSLTFDGLEVAQELMGILLQIFEMLVTFSLLPQLSRKRM